MGHWNHLLIPMAHIFSYITDCYEDVMAISSRLVLDSLVRALKEAAQLLGLIPPFWVRRISCRAFPAHMPGNSFLSDQSGVNVRGLRRVGTDPTGPYQEKGFHDGDLVNGPGTMQGKVPQRGHEQKNRLGSRARRR